MEDYNILIKKRFEKVEELKKKGIKLFKYNFDKEQDIAQIQSEYKDVKDEQTGYTKTAGRLMIKRIHGKSGFADLKDDSGKIQLYFRKDFIGEDQYDLFKILDIGDIIGVEGTLFRTKTGELTVVVKNFELLTKSLRPLPEKFHGLQDKELRYRQRYLDLIVNNNVRETFRKRSRIISFIRRYMEKNGYMEVETPVLQKIYGGGEASPFKTFHNKLDSELYMRIALETYLKRLIVGGYEKVFEMGRVFRNEGMDRNHNPEFTMLEFYAAYHDLYDMMDFTENLIKETIKEIGIELDKLEYEDRVIDLSGNWEKLSMIDAIKKYADIDIKKYKNKELIDILKKEEELENEDLTEGEIIFELFDVYVEPKLINPTFITDYPIDVSPLAKKKRNDNGTKFVERFELFINGWEFANAYSELNDPIEQEKRLKKQEEKFNEGKEETDRLDEDFIRALQYGMPPTGGVGIGVDRLIMLLTNSRTIKDVLFFPHMKDEGINQ
ncbi:MAG TPA: lysine--tRNA ligase [Candidatus Mcinerneyibacterium sp.]|nr:lysine--tRNA ligase [Candidatus Mcinerneyibacterium sp.]